MKRVSLIIPVYNAEKWLPAFFEALDTQDWENLQILFSEDHSEDGSLALLRAYAAREPRATVITGDNLGVSKARNRALELADGDYIGFLDADDTPEPEYLSRLVSALEETGADMACCGFTRIYASSGRSDGLPRKNARRQVTDRDGMARLVLRPDGYTTVVWNKLFRREAITAPDGSLNRFDETLHIVEDGDFIFRSRVESAVFLPERLYRYYVRTSGAMYGAVTDRKLTEPEARRKIARAAETMAPDVRDLARMKYQKGIRDLMLHAVISGEGNKVRYLMPELKTYRRELFASPALSRKDKLKYRVYVPVIVLNLRRTGAFLMARLSGH